MNNKQPIGFTLSELLVVITIMVVLLALLTPALDKAVYQAELAVCATQLRGIGSAATGYAVEHKRFYPYRRIVHDRFGKKQAGYVRSRGLDDRPVLEELLGGLDILVCPLVGDLDLYEDATLIRSPYALWFNHRFYVGEEPATEKGMFRMGDRFTWEGERFATLASDWDLIIRGERALNTHPDREGEMSLVKFQNDEGNPNETWTHARWEIATEQRPPIDLNYVMDDLSVLRLDDVRWDDVDETRTVPVPSEGDSANWSAGWQVYLPPAG